MKLKLEETRGIWWDGKHNAFTGLAEFKGKYYCSFRHSTAHAGVAGDVYVVESSDLKSWKLIKTLRVLADNRDPKLFVFQGKLWVTFYSCPLPMDPHKASTYICCSADAVNFSAPVRICPTNTWLWKMTEFKGKIYATGYSYETSGSSWSSYMYVSEDGTNYSKVSTIVEGQCANECHALFHDDGACYVIVRREIKETLPLLAVSTPPYTVWKTHELKEKLQGPHIFEFRGRTWLAGRVFLPNAIKTGILSLDLKTMAVKQELVLVSSGWDTSYPATLVQGDTLYMSYYSSHDPATLENTVKEAACGVYLAVIKA